MDVQKEKEKKIALLEEEIRKLKSPDRMQIGDNKIVYINKLDIGYDQLIKYAENFNDEYKNYMSNPIEPISSYGRQSSGPFTKYTNGNIFDKYTFQPRYDYNYHNIWKIYYGYMAQVRNMVLVDVEPSHLLDYNSFEKTPFPELLFESGCHITEKKPISKVRSTDKIAKYIKKVPLSRIKLEHIDWVIVKNSLKAIDQSDLDKFGLY